MKNSMAYLTLSILILSVSIAGCYGTNKLHEGAELSKEKVAIIKNIPRMPNRTNKEVIIQSVDGRKSGVYDAAVEVLPGKHELEIYCMLRKETFFKTSVYQNVATIQIIVEAGKEYNLDAQIDNQSCLPEMKEAKK
ncbi:hypothetical protein SCL_0772 [Sulfuricaulis limicola]|uniref:Lipoprotein n=1 Tax=Sulfuricaulis limicola TaxID=1620215 RepID=A0A1B4XE74_9GAMM|nr:hypothetical protein [Sulfuricaulis limicola]BAV33092.1 hypothetical protein SCL_0772 [Sulfuricaulis limicola]